MDLKKEKERKNTQLKQAHEYQVTLESVLELYKRTSDFFNEMNKF